MIALDMLVLVKKLNDMDDTTVCGAVVEGGIGSTKGLVETASATDLESVNALIMKSDAIVYAAEGLMLRQRHVTFIKTWWV